VENAILGLFPIERHPKKPRFLRVAIAASCDGRLFPQSVRPWVADPEIDGCGMSEQHSALAGDRKKPATASCGAG
jgi:hypothetical protein